MEELALPTSDSIIAGRARFDIANIGAMIRGAFDPRVTLALLPDTKGPRVEGLSSEEMRPPLQRAAAA
jgi:hypothetical protein